MFEKSKNTTPDALGKTSRIVEGTKIEGNISSEADFRFDGHLVGNFNSKGRLVLGPSGKITGDIMVESADIEGTFKGNMHVVNMLNIKSTAHVEGDIKAGNFAVEPGAVFNATCSMHAKDSAVKQDAKK